MGNFLYKNNYNLIPLSTEITDYYDLNKFENIFDNQINKYNMLNNYSELKKDLKTFILLKKNEGILFYKTFIDTYSDLKIFIKIYFLQRINNTIRYASLQFYDTFNNNINYFEYTKNIFTKQFDFLNVQFEQINFYSCHETNVHFIDNKK